MTFNLLNPFGIIIEKNNNSNFEFNAKLVMSLVKEHHLVLMRGFSLFSDKIEFSDFCEELGQISLWPFGKVLELKEQQSPDDHIFANSYVPMHWDGMYRKQVPELQVFHCVNAPQENHGGRTVFSNTKLMIKNAKGVELKKWQNTIATYRRNMEFYDSVTQSPLITEHPYNGTMIVRYNEVHTKEKGNLINPVEVEFSGIDQSEISDLIKSLNQSLYSPQNAYFHSWKNGDILIADNFTLLHGREAFTSQSSRHIQRVQVLSDPPFNNPHLVSYK